MSNSRRIKNIPGYFGTYKITESGDVYSNLSNKILKPHIHRGYLRLNLFIDGRFKQWKVHRLVALTFLGPTPKGMEINHKDANKLNNHYKNLEFVTHVQNMEHAWANGCIKTIKNV